MAARNISGMYQHAASSSLHPALATLSDNGQLDIVCQYSQQSLRQACRQDYRFGPVIPGLAVELQLRDGALFVPDNTSYRWPQLSNTARFAAWLESHKVSVLSAVLLSPLLLWWFVFHLMPALASAAVPLVPDAVKVQMGQQTFYALKKTALDPTQLPDELQQNIQKHWQQALRQLPLGEQRYLLHLMRSDTFGANAFALPDGTVVLTDELALLLQDNPDAILAVLLHEIGHVEAQHSVRLVAQSLGTALVLGVIFGDTEGIADLILGSGSSLLQSAFSRDMEREADAYSLQQLVALGKSPTAFADAMQALLQSADHEHSDYEKFLRYLSTHPDTAERIEQAKHYNAH